MADEMLMFDTRQIRKDVADLETSLDNLTKKVANLDKVGVRTLEGELKKLANNGAASLKELATKGEQEARRLKEAFGEGKGNFAWVSEVQKAKTALSNTLQDMQNRVRMFHADRLMTEQKASQAIVANATKEAREVGRAFSDLRTLTNNINQARLKDAQAQAAADRQVLKDQLAERREILAREAAQSRQLFANFDQNMGLDKARIAKSAKESAAVFNEAFAVEAARSAQTFANFDKMMGLDKSRIAKSAKDSASVFQSAFADEAARGKDTFATFEKMMGLDKARIAKSAKESAAVFQAAFTANIGNTGQKLGGAEVVGPYSAFDAIKVKPAEVDRLAGSFKRLTIEGNDMHSMARGLASGFNLLWLTWGNLAPLFAGASISFGLKKTFDIGSEVEYLIKFMETLGQTTDRTGKQMTMASAIIRQEMRNIDQTTQFSLVELSQAMVRLGQAGQSPAEAIATLRPAADLASVGMTDLKTSTDLLIQTQALFNKSTSDMGLMAAQIFKITKSGVLNVEDIAGSMKYASEANTRFGKSLEETLTLLGALAQAGLKGSSGGTALINFYRDLNGRSGPAVKALQQLEKATGSTIKVFDEFGKQRSGIDIFNDIAKAADQLKAKDADKLLAKIFSDRGGRTFFAMVREGTIDLKKMQAELENTKPDELFKAAKGLMDTTKGAMNILQGSLVGALDQVFEAYSDRFKTFITDVTKVIDSQGFKVAVAGMVESVSALYEVLKVVGPTLVTFFAAWAGLKIISGGIAIFQSMAVALAGIAPLLATNVGMLARKTLAVEANSAALISNVAAQRAAAAGADAMTAQMAGTAAAASVMATRVGVAGVALRGLAAVIAFLANPIVGLVATIGLFGAAWFSAKGSAETAMSGTAEMVAKNGKIIESQLLKEIQLATQRNALVVGVGTAEEQRNMRELKANQERLGSRASLLMGRLEDNPNMLPAVKAKMQKDLAETMDILKSNEAAMNKYAQGIYNAELENTRRTEDASRKAESAAKAAAARAKAEADAIALPAVAGSPKYVEGLKIGNDNALREIEKGLNNQLSLLRNHNESANKLLEARHSAGVITEGAYQAEIFRQTREADAQALAAIDAATEKYKTAYEARKSVIEAALNKAEGAKRADDVTRLKQELDNLNNSLETFNEKATADRTKLLTDSFTRMELAIIHAEGAVKKLKNSERDYWKKDADELKKLETMQALEREYQNLNDSVFSLDKASAAGMEAAAEATLKHESHIESLRIKYLEAADAASAFFLANTGAIASGDKEATERYNQLLKIRSEIEKAIANSTTKSAESAAKAYGLAFDKVRAEQLNKLSNGVTDAIMTGLIEGGEAGKRSLRKLIVDELQKPIRLIINAVVNATLGGFVSSILGGGGDAAGGGGGMGGIGALANLVSIGKNVISAIGDGFAGMANEIAYTVQRGLNFLNPSAALGAPGGAATMVGTAGTYVAGIGMGRMAGQFISNGYSAIGRSGNTAVNAGTLIGAYFGPIGAIVGGAIGGIVNRVFGRKLKETGIEGTFSGDKNFEGRRYEFYKGGTFRSDKTKYSDLDEETRSSFAKTYEQLKGNIVDYAKALGLSTDALKDFVFKFKVNLKDLSPEDAQKAIAAEFERMGIAMSDLILGITSEVMNNAGGNRGFLFGVNPDADANKSNANANANTEAVKKFQKAGETSLDTLTRLAGSLLTVNAVFKNTGRALLDASLASGDLASKIIDAFGGNDQFVSLTSSYFENFYSDTEKYKALQGQMGDAFKKLNVEMPKTKDEFRKLVDAQDLTTEAGRANYAALMQIASIFNTMANEADRLAQVEKERLDDIANRRADVENSILRLQGRDAEALANERKKEYEALKKINPELADRTAYMWQLEDAEKERQKQEEIRNKQLDVEIEILKLQGKENEAVALSRQREYDALYKLNPQLADRTAEMWRLADAEKERQRLEEIANKRFDVEIEILKLQGRETEALAMSREREYEALKKTNPELADRTAYMWQLQDAEAARQKAEERAATARSNAMSDLEKAVAAERAVLDKRVSDLTTMTNELRTFFDMLAKHVEELTTSVAGTNPGRLIAAQAAIAAAALMARTGGALGDKNALTEAIQTVRSSLVEENFASQFDLDRARLQLAGQLTDIKDAAGTQLSTAEQQLEAANAAIKVLEDTLEYWKKQIEIAEGTYRETISVAAAVNNLAAVLAGKNSTITPPVTTTPPAGSNVSGGGAVFGGSSSGWINTPAPVLERDAYGRVLYPDGSKGPPVDTWFVGAELHWAEKSPYNPANAGKNLPPLPAFAKGGRHLGGARIVGENGPELEVTDSSYIYNAAETARILSGGGSSSETDARMAMLLERQMADQRAQMGAVVRNQMLIVKLLTRWEGSGLPPTRELEPVKAN